MAGNRIANLLSQPALLRLLTLAAFIYLGAVLFLVQPRPEGANADAPAQAPVQEVEAAVAFGTPSAAPLTDDLDDLHLPHALGFLEVRLGPASGYAVIGQVPKGGLLQVVGRDETSAWLAITFNGGSTLHGWVPMTSVGGIDNPAALKVATITLPPAR